MKNLKPKLFNIHLLLTVIFSLLLASCATDNSVNDTANSAAKTQKSVDTNLNHAANTRRDVPNHLNRSAAFDYNSPALPEKSLTEPKKEEDLTREQGATAKKDANIYQ